MNIVNKLTVRHLLLNRGRTLMTIAGIMLSVAMVCCVAGFVMSVRDMMIRAIKEGRGDYHIAYVNVTPETAEQIAAEDVFSTYYIYDTESDPRYFYDIEEPSGLVNIYLRLDKPGRDFWEVAAGIADKYGLSDSDYGANTELLGLEGGYIASDSTMRVFVTIAAIAIVIIVAGSVIVIANAFYISSSERVRQFGLLKSAGATSGQIGRSILFEAFLLAAIAIPLGIALGFAVQAVALYLTNGLLAELSAINSDKLRFSVVFSPVTVYISVAIAALTVLISAWMPARRAARTSPIDAIRQTKDVRIRSKQLKSSRLTGFIFGFEGTLAAKSLKRSRGKYRATIVALTTSVVLFVSMSSFVGLLNKATVMEYGGYDFDVLVYLWGDIEWQDEMGARLETIPGAEAKKIQQTYFDTIVPDGFITEKALQSVTAENGYGMLLYSIPDAEFAKIAPVTENEVAGVLVNTTGVFKDAGKLREYTPYDCPPGTELLLNIWDGGDEPVLFDSVTIGATVTEIPEQIPASLFDGNLINVLMPESEYRQLHSRMPEDAQEPTTMYAVTAADPDAFCEAADGLLTDGGGMSYTNIAQMTRLNRNLVLIVKLFGYGFIAMLSLIAVTSVIATISTNMRLRKQEFAMLYSAGMTSKGMNKMLNLESVLYGAKSLAIGLPAGVALSYILYFVMGDLAEFPYQPPWFAMAVSAAAVMLLTFATMRYGKSKLGKLSIVEAIRGETA